MQVPRTQYKVQEFKPSRTSPHFSAIIFNYLIIPFIQIAFLEPIFLSAILLWALKLCFDWCYDVICIAYLVQIFKYIYIYVRNKQCEIKLRRSPKNFCFSSLKKKKKASLWSKYPPLLKNISKQCKRSTIKFYSVEQDVMRAYLKIHI